jgi:hypothetical protein
MPPLPWTKFQDFYLRLGFLKVLVSALSPQRRSAANESIYRRLQTPLLAPARIHAKLLEEALAPLPAGVDHGATDQMTVAEALLITGNCPSWLYAITHDTAYKVLDWGHNVHFVGAGNQITERGLLLRHLIPEEPCHAFFSGNPAAWNPFLLTAPEQIFFLYHLCEIDQVTPEIILRLGDHDPGTVLESSDAAVVTCRSLFEVLDRSRSRLAPRDLPAFRTARELACTIARELDLSDLLRTCGGLSSRVPRPRAPSGLGTISRRRTTKNADHQTVPRFEQLIDLGFLAKPVSPADVPASYKTLAQRRWRYQPTERCRFWRDASEGRSAADSRWLWKGFATAAVRSGIGGVAPKPGSPDASTVVRFLTDAYVGVRRQIGHTPFESVALLAMILAASEGYILEMITLHELVLALKKRSLLPDLVFFAAGNELDKMFVLFKPGFERKLLELYDRLHSATGAMTEETPQ